MEDLFEKDFSELPIELQEVLSKYLYDEFDYENCANLVDDLNSIGYTCDYGLDAEPFGLRRLTIYDSWNDMEIDAVFNAILNRVSNNDAEKLRENIVDRHTKIMYLIFCEEISNKVIDN
jgi:hypothetical protein